LQTTALFATPLSAAASLRLEGSSMNDCAGSFVGRFKIAMAILKKRMV